MLGLYILVPTILNILGYWGKGENVSCINYKTLWGKPLNMCV